MENTDFPEWFVELMIDRRRSWLNGHGRLVEEYFAQDQRLADDRSLALDFILGEFCLREDLSEKPAAAEYLNRFPAFAKDLGPLFVAYSGIQAQESASQSGDSTGPHYENPPRQSNRAEGSPGSGSTRIVLDNLQERPGSEIGPYKLMEQIGVGGFGLVFVAEQQRPVHRRVALKVIKPGMDSHDVIARFEAERQALALMDHPNIARVLDGGATDSGRPYFVMELVRGIPITDYCDQHHLALRERLNLFVSVCHAVQHAHQKGIIHRDIKPSNVMVTVHDGQPVVKVIDFGVAKALHQPLTEKTVYTRYSQMIGTPLYMSPEQAEMSGLDIDTRSDIYSLGVLLYELLTGTTPLERKRLSGVAYDELLKIIRNDEPPKPSSRLQQLTKLLPATAARRKADAAKLPRMFRGDLDSITMKALEKDRTRRYETASGLAADIVRYLNDEPVEATPPSTAYRLKKLARRYRAALVTAAAFVGLLVAGVIVSTWFALLAAKHAKVASSEADNARRAGIAAEAERQRADASAVLARQRREEAEDEKNRAQAALNRSEWLRYESHLSAAQREWETHNAALAHQHLDACRWDFRGWEHDFLYSFFTADHRVLGEHQEGVRCVAYQRTGRLVASGSVDKSVKIWDANSGKEVATLRGHAASVLAVAFSPDSTRLASGDGEGSVKLWDVAKAVLLYSIAAPGEGEIRSVAFSPDGRQIAGGSQGGSILVWDAATGKKTRSLAAHSDAVDGIAFSPDGRQMASVGEDQLLKLWDAANGKLIRTFKGHSNHVFGVGFSPDGRMIVSGGMDRAVRIWETSTGTCLRTLSGHTAAITCVGFLPDGEHVASGSEDSTIRIWNVDTGIETKTFTGHAASINDLAIAPDGREIVSASDDWTVRIWELKNERTIDIDDIVQTTPASSQLESAPAPRPDKERAGDVSPGSAPRSQPASPPSKGAAAGATAIPGSAGSVISHPLPKALAPPTKQPPRTPVIHWPRPHLSPDGRYLALAGLDKSISLWNTEDCSRFQTLNGEKGIILAADFSPDGSRLATGDEDGCVKVWDIHAAHAQLVMRGHSGSVGCVVFSQDGKKIASGGLDASVRIWDSTSGREMAVFKGNGSPIWAIAFSPVGDRLGAGRMDGTIQCWDSARGRNAIVLAGHRRPVTCLAYSPDGRRIASGSDDQTVRCWDATNGRELLDLAGDFSPVTTVIFSPDGRRILSSSPRSSIKVWDANSGLDLLTVKGDNDVFSRVAFSRDLRQFVSTADGFIKVWRPIHQQEVLRLASTARITNVAFAPDGQRLACATAEGTVTLSSASNGQESLVLKGHSGDALCVAFNRDGTRLASGGVDKTVRVWDAARGREVIKLDASTGPVATVTFSPNGTSIACGGPDGTVRVWDPSSRQEIAALKGHTAAVTGVAFSPDGKRLASGSADRTVRCWDLADPRKLIIFRHPAAVTSVAFSPDGKRLVSGGSDGVAWVWDASTGRQTLSLKGHKQSVSKVAFSPDGTWIVSGSLDRAVKLWDAATGAEILTLRDYADPVIGLAVSPDGKRIALVNRQGAADVWMLPESINGSVVSER